MNPPSRRFKNRILSSLPTSDLNRIVRLLTPITLEQQKTLLDGEIEHCYFVEQGIASVVVTVDDGTTVEVGIIGVDGVVGLPILLGSPQIPGRTFVQIAGSGFRIASRDLKAEFERNGPLREHVQRYLLAFFVQTAQTAVCNRLHTIEERLARWLLSCRDRMESDELHLTHEFLGQMLGAPRTTVTMAAGILQRAGMIDYARGVVTVKNRPMLEESACECYAIVRDEFKKLSLL
jgi:CRP-like cAMP-binding protein